MTDKLNRPHKMYDVHQMYQKEGWKMNHVLGNQVVWVSTVAYNMTYTLARGIKRHKESKPNVFPKGTFFIIVPNGTKDPVQWLREKKNKSTEQ